MTAPPSKCSRCDGTGKIPGTPGYTVTCAGCLGTGLEPIAVTLRAVQSGPVDPPIRPSLESGPVELTVAEMRSMQSFLADRALQLETDLETKVRRSPGINRQAKGYVQQQVYSCRIVAAMLGHDINERG